MILDGADRHATRAALVIPPSVNAGVKSDHGSGGIGLLRADQFLRMHNQGLFGGVEDLVRITGIGQGRLRDIMMEDLACAG